MLLHKCAHNFIQSYTTHCSAHTYIKCLHIICSPSIANSSVGQQTSTTFFVFFLFNFWNMVIWQRFFQVEFLEWVTTNAWKWLSINSDSVVGRWNKSFQFWRGTLQTKEFVIDVISNDYKLPLLRYPPRWFININKSALEHKVFVEQAISKLLQDGCISRVSAYPGCQHCHIVNPLSVITGKKLRLGLNLTHVNPYSVKPKFKYDNLRRLSEIFYQNFWFFTLHFTLQ